MVASAAAAAMAGTAWPRAIAPGPSERCRLRSFPPSALARGAVARGPPPPPPPPVYRLIHPHRLAIISMPWKKKTAGREAARRARRQRQLQSRLMIVMITLAVVLPGGTGQGAGIERGAYALQRSRERSREAIVRKRLRPAHVLRREVFRVRPGEAHQR